MDIVHQAPATSIAQQRRFALRISLVALATVTVFWSAADSALAAEPGLPLTEDFADQNLRDPQRTSANWSSVEQRVVLGSATQREPTFNSDGESVGSETDNTRVVVLADLDNDGDLDLISGNVGTGRRYLNDGEGNFSATGTAITNALEASNDIAVGDIDNDGDLDFVSGRPGQNNYYANDGSGGFSFLSVVGSETDSTAALLLADIDNDGDLDLIAGNEGQTNKLYTNTSGVFSATGVALGSESDDTVAIALGDVDSDGDLDLIAANLGQNRLYLNDGSGGFSATGTALGSESESSLAVVLGDIDGDGDLDLISGGFSVPSRVYLNSGNGTFSASGAAISGTSLLAGDFALNDIDQDGDLDLITSDNGAGPRFNLNNGQGGFSAATVIDQTSTGSAALTLGDVDRDGDIDLVAADFGEVNRLYRNLDVGGLGGNDSDLGSETSQTAELALGDLDGDGDLDLLRVIQNLPDLIYLNDGTGSYSTNGIAVTAETDSTLSMVLGDIDGDGDLDFISGTAATQPIKRYINDGSGGFGVVGTVVGSETDNTRSLALGDVDGDGDLDLVVGNLNGANKYYINDGLGGFGASALTLDSAVDFTTEIRLGDVDGDGDLDVVAAVSGDSNKLYLNAGDGTFGAPQSVGSETDNSQSLEVGDVDLDGDLDVVVGNLSATNKLFINDGSGQFSASGVDVGAETTTGNALILFDVDGDGDLDVVSGGGLANDLVHFNNGENAFSASGTAITNTNDTTYFAQGDVDADGDIDLIAGKSFGEVTQRYLNGSASAFAVKAQTATNDSDDTNDVVLADINGDGNVDLLTSVREFGNNKLYLGDGEGGFGLTGTEFATDSLETRMLAVADVDSDGDLDVVTINSAQSTAELNRLYLNDGSGNLPATGTAVGSAAELSIAAVFGDTDNDGDPDLIVSNGILGNKLFTNNGAGGFSATGADISSDFILSQSLILADFDGDGDLDLVAGNIGDENRIYLNTGGTFGAGANVGNETDDTRALVSGDFDGDGDIDVVAANSGTPNRLYLNNGSGGFGATGVAVGSQSDDSIALVSADVNQDGSLDLVVGNGFSEISRYYLNDGNGNFVQSTVIGDSTDTTSTLGVADVNNDGSLDLVTGNSFAVNQVFLSGGASTQAGVAASLTVNTGENVLAATLSSVAQVNTATTRNTVIDYFLSNNGGARWFKIEPGVEHIFPTLGDDLRWRARLASLSPAISPVLTEIQITRRNAVPTASDGVISLAEDTSYTFQSGDFGYQDAEEDPFTSIRVSALESAGSLELNGNPVLLNQVIGVDQIGNLTYQPAINAFGNAYDSLSFVVSDPMDEAAAPNQLVVDVTAVNDPPVGTDDSGPDVPGGTGFVQFAHGDLLANDSPGALESDTLSIVSVDNAVGGSVALGPPIGFTPTPGFDGVASFQYTLQDNGTTNGAADPRTAVATVSFNILSAPNGPPTLTTELPDISRAAGAGFNDAIGIFFTDPDGDTLRYTAIGLPATLSLDPDSGILSGSTAPSDLANSPFTVEVTADDQISGTVSDTFTLTLTNQAPQQIIPLGTYQPAAGENRLIDLAPHFVDPDGLPLQFSVSGSTSVSINALGQPGLMQVTANQSQVDQPLNVTVTVTDAAGSQIQAQVDMLVASPSAPDYRFERFFPSLQQPWYFSRVSDIVGAPDGSMYLADAERGTVQRFSRDGLLITQWGSLGAGSSQFSLLKLKLAVVPNGNVFAASAGRLQVFEPNGRFLIELPDFGEDIVDLTIDASGQLIVLFDRRVEIRPVDDLNGSLASFNLSRDGAAVAAGPSGRIYISVRSPLGGAADQVRVFDPQTLTEIPGERITTTDADDLAVDSAEQVFAVGSSDGTVRAYSGGFEFLASDVSSFAGNSLAAIAFDTSGRVYLSNSEAVIGLDAGLSMRSLAWQSGGSEQGRFDAPSALSVDDAGNIYVLDPRQSRIQKFLINGVPTDQWNLITPLTNPDNRRVFIRATTDNRIIVSTGDSLEVFDTSGNPATPINVAGLDNPGPFAQTRSGNLILTTATAGGFDVYQVNSAGQTVGMPFALDTCQAADLAVGQDNLIYVLCKPGVNIREIQVYTQAGNKVRTFNNLPMGNPKALTLDERDRIHLLGTENEVDLGSGVVTADSVVRIFQSDGGSLSSVGSGGYSAGRFDFGGETVGADIGPGGELVVAEPGNNRVQIMQPASLGRNTKAIVVAGGGDYPENYLWEATQINTNNAYDKLIYQGFTAERILYLHPDLNLDLDGNASTQEVDGAPTIENLAAAFEPGGFAADADNLVFYLADHGNTDVFRMNPLEIVTASQVAGWLAQLQNTTWPSRPLPPGGFNGWVSVIYEACESGSFQDDLAPSDGIATNKRLVITTSNDGQNANFIAQGFLSFSYQFWINSFNGFDVRDAFDTATLTIKDTYPEQDPILTVIDRGQAVNDLDDYFLQGRPNFNFAGRQVGNGTDNNFAGPAIMGPIVPLNLTNSASGTIEVEAIDDPDGIARAWAVLQPPEYFVRDTANPVLELPTIDLQRNPTGPLPDRFTATYSNFTTEGDYRVDILAQDVFGNVTKYDDSTLTVTVGNPPKNKAILLVSGDSSDRGQAFLANGDFAYRALLQQDYVNDLDPATPNVTNVSDEIRYYTQGQFAGADTASPTQSQLDSLNSAFVDTMTLNLVIYLAADYNVMTDAFEFPGISDPITIAGLQGFLDQAENLVQGRIVLVLEGDDTGTVLSRLVDGSAKRLVLSSAGQGGVSSLTGSGGISFSKFFWNAVRDGFSLGIAFELAADAVSAVDSVQTPLIDDNGNGVANEPNDQIVSRDFFLGPGITRAGNGPLIGSVRPDLTIDLAATTSATVLAEDVSGTSLVSRVVGNVTVPAAGMDLGTFELFPTTSQKGQSLINLGDFQGTFSGFESAGDYTIAVFAIDENGDPSLPQTTTLRKTAGADIYELDDTPNTGTQTLLSGAAQRHTIHSITQPNTLDDEDWLILSLSDAPVRQARFTFSDLDPGLSLRVQLFDDSRLANDAVVAVLDEVVLPQGATTQNVIIDDALSGGRYVARITAESVNTVALQDPSPGYLVGLSTPFADLEGELAGRIFDAQTLRPVTALVQGMVGANPVGQSFSCFKNCGPLGGEGGFRLRMPQGSYDLRVISEGYDTQVVAGLNITPGAVTPMTRNPILLQPQTTAQPPTVSSLTLQNPGEQSVTLSGQVNANGSEAVGAFQLLVAGSAAAPVDPSFLVTGSANTAVSTSLTGLDCNTTFTVSLAASNAGGLSETPSQTFTTDTCSTGSVIFVDGFEN